MNPLMAAFVAATVFLPLAMHATGANTLRMASVLSTAMDTPWAAAQACEVVQHKLGSADIDLACVFFNPQHIENVEALSDTIREKLRPGVMVGASTCAAIAGGVEVERGAGLSILACSMPGVSVRTFSPNDLPAVDTPDAAIHEWGPVVGASDELRATMLLVDPTSVPIMKLLPLFNAAVGTQRNVALADNPRRKAPVLFGGIASATNKAGGNVLLLDDKMPQHGLVGVSLSGKLHVDTVVSQGCKPFGPTMVITKAKNNMIFELGGRRALDVVQEAVEELGDDPRLALQGGLYAGVVIDEYKPRFGRDDFLIRNVVGVDTNLGCIALADFVRVGQTVRMHVRDKQTASEDLALLMDAQRLYDPPDGALLITCNGRGERTFGVRNHDVAAVQRAFTQDRAGPDAAGGGLYLDPSAAAPIPMAGFHAAGEIGPVGNRSFLHGQTACVAMFRGA